MPILSKYSNENLVYSHRITHEYELNSGTIEGYFVLPKKLAEGYMPNHFKPCQLLKDKWCKFMGIDPDLIIIDSLFWEEGDYFVINYRLKSLTPDS